MSGETDDVRGSLFSDPMFSLTGIIERAYGNKNRGKFIKVNRKMWVLGNKKIFSRSDLVHVLRTRSRVLVNFREEKENDVCAKATLEVLKSGS